jgi:hypothetical protein
LGGVEVWDVGPEQLADMSGRQLLELLLAMSKGGGTAGDVQWQAVLAHIAEGGTRTLRGCGDICLARMAHAVVKLCEPHLAEGEVLAGVVVIDKAAVALVLDGRFRHQNCAMLAINFAKLGYYDALWFPHLAKVAGDRDWSGIVPQSISNLVYGYAVAGHCKSSQALVDDMIVAALPQLQGFKPQEIANLVWALAKLGHPLDRQQLLERAEAALAGVGDLDASSLLHLLLERGAMHQLGSCTTQNLANLLWGCGELKDQHGGGLEVDGAHVEALVGALVRNAGRCQSQAISNTFVAVVALGHPMQQSQVDALVSTLAGVALRTPGRLLPQAVSNTLWGCASIGSTVCPVDCGALVGWLVQNISSCKPQQVANTVWALSRLQPASGSTQQQQLQPSTVQLLEALPAFVEANKKGFNPQEMSNTALAAATLEYHVPGLMAALLAAARPQLQSFNCQDLANLLWALALLEPMESQQVFRELEQTVAGMLGSLTGQGVGNIAWGYSVVLGQQVDRQLATALLQRAVEVQGDLKVEEKRQLYSMVMLLPADVAATLQPEVQRLVQECRAANVAAGRVSLASQVQRQVYQVLRGIGEGLQPELEHVAEGGLFCIDIAFNLAAGPGQRVAVEVDGPTHYTRSMPYRELGATLLRRRLLERHRWRVVSVPVREWREQMDKAGYLRGLLSKGGCDGLWE